MAMSCLRHSWTDDNEKVTKDSIPKLLWLVVGNDDDWKINLYALKK